MPEIGTITFSINKTDRIIYLPLDDIFSTDLRPATVTRSSSGGIGNVTVSGSIVPGRFGRRARKQLSSQTSYTGDGEDTFHIHTFEYVRYISQIKMEN